TDGRGFIDAVHSRGLDGCAQAFLPRSGPAALGNLWFPGCDQSDSGLGVADLHGAEPGADGRDDRKLSHGPDLEAVHVESGDTPDAGTDRVQAGRDAPAVDFR